MARVLYVIGILAVIGAVAWLLEVLRAIGVPQTTPEYQEVAWAAALPVNAMLGGVLVVAFGVVLARLKAIQYASELSADALVEMACRDRSRLVPLPSADSASSASKSPVGQEARAAQPSDRVASQTQEAAAALAVTMAAIKEATAADAPVRAQAIPMKRDVSSSAKPLPSLAAMKTALNSSRNHRSRADDAGEVGPRGREPVARTPSVISRQSNVAAVA